MHLSGSVFSELS